MHLLFAARGPVSSGTMIHCEQRERGRSKAGIMVQIFVAITEFRVTGIHASPDKTERKSSIVDGALQTHSSVVQTAP